MARNPNRRPVVWMLQALRGAVHKHRIVAERLEDALDNEGDKTWNDLLALLHARKVVGISEAEECFRDIGLLDPHQPALPEQHFPEEIHDKG